ncbi:MAG: hypothetical protein KJ621_12485 [Proteobacteria bacterium]|nr:hypothetical protein [Pseudomonadota bacterium]
MKIILAMAISHPGARARLIESGALDWLAERVGWLGPVVEAVKDLHNWPLGGGWPSDLFDYPGVWDLRHDLVACGQLWSRVVYEDGLDIDEFMDLLFPADSEDMEAATAARRGEPHRRTTDPKVVRLFSPAGSGRGEGVGKS